MGLTDSKTDLRTGVESLIVKEKALGMHSLVIIGIGKLQVSYREAGHAMSLFEEHVWLSLVDPELGARKTMEILSAIEQVLIILGQLLQRLWFAFLSWL